MKWDSGLLVTEPLSLFIYGSKNPPPQGGLQIALRALFCAYTDGCFTNIDAKNDCDVTKFGMQESDIKKGVKAVSTGYGRAFQALDERGLTMCDLQRGQGSKQY